MYVFVLNFELSKLVLWYSLFIRSNEFILFNFVQDKVGSWYSNPGAGMVESGAVGGGGVGKYLKLRNVQTGSATSGDGSAENVVVKKRKIAASTGGFGNFSSW